MNKKKIALVALALIVLFPLTALAADFEIENFNFWNNEYGQTIFIGEIINNSGNAYNLAIFQLALFDTNDKMLDVHQINMTNFSPGERRSFKIAAFRVYPKKLKYRLDFDGGMP
jgi:hypothetical protein